MPRYDYDPTRPSIILGVETPAIKPTVQEQFEADGFRLKDEFHITILGREAGTKLGRAQCSQIAQTLGRLTLPNFSYGDTLYHISKPKQPSDSTATSSPRESLVAPVISAGIDGDLGFIERTLNISLVRPYLHLTIATRPDTDIARQGIGVASVEDWAALEPQLYAPDWQV